MVQFDYHGVTLIKLTKYIVKKYGFSNNGDKYLCIDFAYSYRTLADVRKEIKSVKTMMKNEQLHRKALAELSPDDIYY